MNAVVEIQTHRPVSLELYKDFKELGRFMLRYVGSTIAAGVVTEVQQRPAQTHRHSCHKPTTFVFSSDQRVTGGGLHAARDKEHFLPSRPSITRNL